MCSVIHASSWRNTARSSWSIFASGAWPSGRISTPPNVWRSSHAKISGCAVANSTMPRASGSLAGERPGADLLVRRRPRPREVAVEIDRVVAEEERRRDRACRRSARSCPRDRACRTGPRPRACARRAGPGTRAPRRARRPDRCTRIASARPSPSTSPGIQRGCAALDARVARHRAHRAAGAQHALGAVGRDPRHDVEQDLAQPLERSAPGRSSESGSRWSAQRVLGDRERDARAGELGRVDVAVDPHRRADAVGLGADRRAARRRGPRASCASDVSRHERRDTRLPTRGTARSAARSRGRR